MPTWNKGAHQPYVAPEDYAHPGLRVPLCPVFPLKTMPTWNKGAYVAPEDYAYLE